MKNDFDFIKDKFDADGITAPESLSEYNILDSLENTSQKKIRFYNRPTFKGIVGVAACFALVLTTILVVNPFSENKVEMNNNPQEKIAVLSTFENIDDIKSTIKDIDKNNRSFGFLDDISFAISNATSKGDTVYEAATDTSTGPVSNDKSYSETYVQVEGIDEGDIIKNDGEYIYHISLNTGVLNIFDKKGTLVSSIDEYKDICTYTCVGDEVFFEEKTDEKDSPTYAKYITEIYVYGDTLIVNTNEYPDDYSDSLPSQSGTYMYDISDRSKPKLVKSFSQSGDYVSSRLMGNMLYVVSNEYVYSNNCDDDSDYLPYVCNGGTRKTLKAEDIYYGEKPSSSSYLVVSTINTDSLKRATDTKAILGAGSDVYCNKDNMYIAMNDYDYKFVSGEYHSETSVQLVKAKLTDNGVEFVATAKVNGNLNNQFSMDEYDGNLRVATTSYNKKEELINNIYVLDSDMKSIGSVKGFAKNEEIKAVRFMGNTAYVITYEQTDPLFVIDMKNPTAPEIKGEVKISGFSTTLIPAGDNRLIGIGYSTKEYYESQMTDGIKIVLFDVSNPQKPKVLDSMVMQDPRPISDDRHTTFYSSAQNSSKAVVVNKDKNYYAIPYMHCGNNADDIGVITFTIDNDKVNVTNNFKVKSNYSIDPRCTYIDDTIYLLGSDNDIYLFECK